MTVRQTHHYKAFGLEIVSDLAMPELAQGTGAPTDVTIRAGTIEGELAYAEQPVLYRFREESGDTRDLMSWNEVASFEISGDDRITYAGAPGSGDALVSLPMLGPVMAILLHRRGLLTLHGSAINIEGRAAVFLGDKGAGKSTTAAALVQAGYPLVTDDIVAVALGQGETPLVWPGYPQVKLTDNATEALPFADAETMPSPHPDFGKHRHLLGGEFDCASVPLSEAVVLQRGEELAIERLAGMDAVQALMRFSYVTRFGERVLAGVTKATHFRQCVEIAQTATVCRLTVPHDLTRLSAVADALKAFRATQPASYS
ncbi:hypothetical protein BH09PSE1_BH09PSE1_04980 [soil metagenome]